MASIKSKILLDQSKIHSLQETIDNLSKQIAQEQEKCNTFSKSAQEKEHQIAAKEIALQESKKKLVDLESLYNAKTSQGNEDLQKLRTLVEQDQQEIAKLKDKSRHMSVQVHEEQSKTRVLEDILKKREDALGQKEQELSQEKGKLMHLMEQIKQTQLNELKKAEMLDALSKKMEYERQKYHQTVEAKDRQIFEEKTKALQVGEQLAKYAEQTKQIDELRNMIASFKPAKDAQVEQAIASLNSKFLDVEKRLDVPQLTHQQVNLLIEQKLSQVEVALKSQIEQVSDMLQEEMEQVRQFCTKMFEEFAKSMPSVEQKLNTSAIMRESSAALEQTKTEMEMKVTNMTRDMEEKWANKVNAVDYKVTQSVTILQRLVDEKLDRQAKIIGKMTEEARWIEEEGIRLRVEHEAKTERQLKHMKEDVEKMITESTFRVYNGFLSKSAPHNAAFVLPDKTQQEEYTQLFEKVKNLEQHQYHQQQTAKVVLQPQQSASNHSTPIRALFHNLLSPSKPITTTTAPIKEEPKAKRSLNSSLDNSTSDPLVEKKMFELAGRVNMLESYFKRDKEASQYAVDALVSKSNHFT